VKRLVLLFLLSAVASMATTAQEVIVFSDSRSLVVASHREQGLWTYLKVDNGELAVKTSRIIQIRKEGAEAQQSARAAAAATPSPSPAGSQPEKPPPPPSPPKPQPLPQGDEDDDDQPHPPDGQPPPPSRALSPARSMPPTAAGPTGGQPQRPGGAGGPVGR
jgi:hypothetical protein